MRIIRSYEGRESFFESALTEITVGRADGDNHPDIDLTPDMGVSRRHALITVRNGQVWVEDLGSRRGTRVNDRDIRGRGPTAVSEGDEVRLGASVLKIDPSRATSTRGPAPLPADLTAGTVLHTLAASAAISPYSNSTAAADRLALLYALPIELGASPHIDHLIETIAKRLIDVIPGAQRSAVLIQDRLNGQLLLKAHEPAGTPAVSLSLAHQVMESAEAILWDLTSDPSISQIELGVHSAMYAPIVWSEKALGVICVDNFQSKAAFDHDDLTLLLAVAKYAAMAVAHRQLNDDLAQNATLLSRLLTNFSPRIRNRLLAKAQQGRLRLGGEKTEVTILCSDIRSFTRISAKMDPEDVVDMLNDYLSVLVEALFQYEGTIDKFVGDAILAVFGSPEPDPQQHEKAVRAAVQMQSAVQNLNQRRTNLGLVTCDIGIGIHCGEVVHGFIGAADRMEFTVIGDAVNFASRYCDAAKASEVLISQALHQHVWRSVNALPMSVSTKHEGDLPAYLVRGLK